MGFFEKYPPAADLKEPSEHIIQACRGVGFPDEIIDFMKEHGFGNYGDGIIKVIDPEEYMRSLYTWLGQEDYSKIPIMMTGFGDIFYFRNLGDSEYDISLLDIHYRSITVPAWTFSDFLAFLCDPEIEEQVLRRSIFDSAQEKCGPLAPEEIYYFVPALIAGGAEDIKYVDKGKAAVHQQVLFQLGNR